MNGETINKKLSLEEMQDLLSDYAFEKLSENEDKIFEYNLQFYPELNQEIEDVRAVFKSIDNMDMDKFLSERTKDLSVKVNHKREKRKYQKQTGLKRFLLPVAIMMLIAFIVGEYKLSDVIDYVIGNEKHSEVFNQKEMAILISDEENDLINFIQPESKTEDLALAFDKSSELDELAYEHIDLEDAENMEYFDLLLQSNPANKNLIERTLSKSDISENDFQNLIKELGNASFN